MNGSTSWPLAVLVAVTFFAGVVVSEGLRAGMGAQDITKSGAIIVVAGARP